MSLPLLGGGSGAGAIGGGGATTASDYLARVSVARGSDLDATHISAFTTFLDGLDTDLLTAAFDLLVWTANQDSIAALINMVSSSYTGVSHGSPTFTADRGFTGTLNSTTIYIDTAFGAASAVSPKFVQNSAHFSVWSVTDVGVVARPAMGVIDTSRENTLYPRFSDGNAYFRTNDNGALGGVANATPTGHYIANRSNSTDEQGYKNGSSVKTTTSANSVAVPGLNFDVLGHNLAGTHTGSSHQIALYSIGRSLNSTEAGNFYTRARTCATALGVP